MRVNVDSTTLSDPRFVKLSRTLAINRFEAVGRILQVWFACYGKRSPILSVEDVDIASEFDGFAEGMITSGLAVRRNRGTLSVSGVKDRITYLLEQKRLGAAGAEARWGKSTLRNNYPVMRDGERHSDRHSDRHADPIAGPIGSKNGPYSLPLVPSPDPFPAPSPAQNIAEVRPPPSGPVVDSKPKPAPHPDHKRFVDSFNSLYRDASGGTNHTWGPKEGAMVRKLLLANGYDVAIERAENLFRSPPEWLVRDGSCPDLGVLVSQFNRLARPAGSTGFANPNNVTAREMFALAEEAKRRKL